MLKLIAFDFDDTLCLTEEACFSLENSVAQQMGHAPMKREAHLKNWGKPLEEAITERIPGIDAALFMQQITKAVATNVANGTFDVISDKNIQILQKLKDQGKRLAILTSRTTPELKHILDENHHLNKYIETVYHADNIDYRKPDPRVFDQLLKDFEILPHEALYVGDSLGDAVSAKGAGLHFVASLESRIRTRDEFAHLSVDAFVEKFEDILSYKYLWED